MRKIFVIAAAAILTALLGCESLIDPGEKPEVKERAGNFKIRFTDETGSMNKLYGSPYVPGVSVLVKSLTIGTEYHLTSGADGIVELTGALSDKYLVSAVRLMSGSEMEILTGQHIDFYKLVPDASGFIDLSADSKDIIDIKLNKLELESPLVISEIYACGPPEAGLYFHDKYVEIYNQSDSTIYLDGMMIGLVYASSYLGLNWVNDPEFVHTKNIWMFPGSGNEHPIAPGEYIVCAEDAIDHRINAPKSIDLSHVRFEFYKDDAPDIDNPAVPNMIKIFQDAGNDWLLGGEKGGVVIAQYNPDSLKWYDEHLLLPFSAVLDGVEYMGDVTRLDQKIVSPILDKGAAGGISFYTGKSMERIITGRNGKTILKDENNSSLDFKVYDHPSPQYHN